MIGYYLHHVGLGHLHRGLATVAHLPGPVTALSSRPVDARWPGPWLELPRDDRDPHPLDPTAGGALHWAPVRDAGLRGRMGLIAEWIATHRPDVMVVDLSVEVLTLARVFGVPVVAVTLPGVRDDEAHRRGYELADAIIAPWPARFAELGPSLEPFAAKVRHVGAVSRYEDRAVRDPDGPGDRSADERPTRRLLVMTGTGSQKDVVHLPCLPGWNRTDIGPANWNPDPWSDIRRADLVVTHAGLGTLADIALARRAAVVIPQARPHEEQVTTAATLRCAGLATVPARAPVDPRQWCDVLAEAVERGGERWQEWADGSGGRRMAAVITEVADRFG